MNDFMTCFFPSVLWQASYFTSAQPAKMCLVFMCVCLWVCVCAQSDYGLDMTDTHTSAHQQNTHTLQDAVENEACSRQCSHNQFVFLGGSLRSMKRQTLRPLKRKGGGGRNRWQWGGVRRPEKL